MPPASLQVAPIYRLAPSDMPGVGAGLPAIPAGPLANTVPARPIMVRGVAVEGVTVYPQDDIDPLVEDLVGPAVSLQRIEEARLALVRKYRQDGYPLVSVQATRGGDGVLRFVVFEGHVAEVKLEGDIGPAGTQVLRFLQRLTETKPLDVASMERWLLLAQDVPGVSLQAVLRPSEAEPGALTLVANVRRTPVSGMIAADNRGYNLTGPQQGLAIVDFNSFSSLGERTELSIFSSFNRTQIYGQASSEVFAGHSGLRVRVYAGAGNTQPSGFLQQLGYDGNTTVVGGQLTYPLIRAREQTMNVIAAFDLLDTNITTSATLEGERAARASASKDSLRVGRIGFDYALQDIVAGEDRPAVNAIMFRLHHGLAALGATIDTATPARAGARGDFFKASAEVSRNQTLFYPWSDASVSLLGLAAGQASPDVLPPAEKFFLGGYRFTRGFYSGQASGDNVAALTAELQLTTSDQVTAFERTIAVSTQYYLFYDYGQTWENQSTDRNRVLRSTGLGVRLSLDQRVWLNAEVVRRLTLQPDGENTKKMGEYAGYWGLKVWF